MDVSYKRDGNRSYMVVSMERNMLEENDFRLKMLQHNHICGLLDMTFTIRDQLIEFYYDITSKSNMDAFWMKGNITYEQMNGFHQGMAEMMWNIRK